MAELTPKEPQERPSFSNEDFQILGSITSNIDEACRVFQDPAQREQALWSLLDHAVTVSRDREEERPVLSAVLIAEAFGAAPSYATAQSLESMLRVNKNLDNKTKDALRDMSQTKFRHEGNGAPAFDVARVIAETAGNALSALQRQEVNDPTIDNSIPKFAFMAFAAGATAGQPQFAATDQLMRYARANITSEV